MRDGKQRLETFFDFIDGAFPLDQKFKLNSDPSLKLGGQYYLDLKLNHTSVAEKFESYTPSIMSWISAQLDKPTTRITQEDIDRLLGSLKA